MTLPNNFVTVFHALTEDLGIETPWPRPDGYAPENASKIVLIWGGSSSVGQFAIQILKFYGYTSVIATASRKHHERLLGLGATAVFDYNDADSVSLISQEAGSIGVSFILDCIGSKQGSIAPISLIAKRGTRVAILLPVIVKDSTEEQDPEYEMDVEKAAEWLEGVDVRGVRTHFYLNVSIACVDICLSQSSMTDETQNEFFKYHLQPDVMHTMLKDGIVSPQNQRIVEGETMLHRAQKAMDLLRQKQASMERLVWRISDAE